MTNKCNLLQLFVNLNTKDKASYRKFIFDIHPHQSTLFVFKPHLRYFGCTVHLIIYDVIGGHQTTFLII